ncbi:MAG: hypothetical protein HY681_06120, partial [Chloroflexi bacterium]|nr:hypothetical protein [Chloroflexota bacterium]
MQNAGSPEAQPIVAALGPDSSVFRHAREGLAHLLDVLSGPPALHVRFAYWQRSMGLQPSDALANQDAFLRHTYLAAVA